MKYFNFLTILFVSYFSFVSPTRAQNNPAPDPREMMRRVMMPVVYKIPGTERVKVSPNLSYGKTGDKNLLMDFYLPPDLKPGEKRPAIIFIHGTAKPSWTPKDWGVYTSWGRLVAAHNFVGVTFTHRLESANKSLENAAADLTDAVNFVRANSDKYNVDKDCICLAAFSAGGSLLSTAMRSDMPFIKCVAGFYALLDARQSNLQKTETPETLKTFSPVVYLENDAKKLPPIFLARAGLDTVPGVNDSIDRFAQVAAAKNIAFNFVNHPNGVHGFDNQTDDARSREIIRAAIEFFTAHLTAPTPAATK